MQFRRRQIMGLLFLVTAILSGCGNEVVLPDDADEQIIQGFEVFNLRCSKCHGRDGGGGIGLNLQQIEERLTDDEQREVIVNGRKRMPKFGDTLSEDDIEAVIRFSREIL